jgi:hypothetical protein
MAGMLISQGVLLLVLFAYGTATAALSNLWHTAGWLSQVEHSPKAKRRQHGETAAATAFGHQCSITSSLSLANRLSMCQHAAQQVGR